MDHLKRLPNIDEILKHPEVVILLEAVRRDIVVNQVREIVEGLRRSLRAQPKLASKADWIKEVVAQLTARIGTLQEGSLRTVINGTGVVLHTNLGRAPLPAQAIERAVNLASGYTNLELDLGTGERGSRYYHLEELLTALTGAEAALVVNNNAAAVLLGLNTMANGREVIVSRGQLVEIGGAFRIPEVMKSSGAKLVEVGTTNKTYPGDFQQAIRPETALLFSAHTSNYRIVGFTREIGLKELVALGRQAGLPVMHDLGSGALFDLTPWGLEDEPTVQASVALGVDIITFSGDKLLGGPQAGLIVGKRVCIEAMKKNQLLRALRVDKLTIASLEGALQAYLGGAPHLDIPILHMLTREETELKQRSHSLCQGIRDLIGEHALVASINVLALTDKVGGGAYPIHELPGFGVQIAFASRLEGIARRLRLGRPALLTRLQDNHLLISVRTLLPGEAEQVPHLLQSVLEQMH